MSASPQDPALGAMIRPREQKSPVATFRYDTYRNLDPALYTHSEFANTPQGTDWKWRTMANESL